MLNSRGTNGAFTFMASALLLFGSASGQQSHVVLNDAKVVVTEIEMTPATPFSLASGQNGAVWVALDPVTLLTGDGRVRRKVQAGEGQFQQQDGTVQFRVSTGQVGRLVVLRLKAALRQPLTVLPVVFDGHDIEDGSARNETLLVAIDDCRFRDTRDLGNESEWVPGKPEIVVMKAGEVKWIRPGIHHFKDLNATPGRLVSIEW